MPTLQSKPRRFIDFWKIEDQKVLCGTINGSYSLDEISSFIWQRCDGHQTVEQIIADLVAVTKMHGHEDVVRSDVQNLLENWQNERLIIYDFSPLHAFSEHNAERLYEIAAPVTDAEILLLVPPSPNPSTGMNRRVQSTFPLGIGQLSAVLREHGYRVAMANLWLTQVNRRSLAHFLSTVKPKVLGISTMTDNFPNGVTIAQIARELLPDIKIVFGGPHVTFTDMESMEQHPEIDVVVRNEGEFTLLELMDLWIRGYGSMGRIRGITYRHDGQIKRNGARPLIHNLDELPLPDRGELNLDQGLVGIQTSRGCPGRCIFCVASSMAGGQYRIRTAEHVVDEMLHLYRSGARRFFFQDDTVTAHPERLYKVLDLIHRLDLKIDWSAESRVDVVDKDPAIFEKMAKAGCSWVQFGVEAGAQEILDSLEKNIEVDQIFRAIRAANAAGLQVACTMLMGHPFDTPSSIEHAVNFARQLNDLGAYTLFSIVVPYPGTKLQRMAEEFGLKIYPTDYSDYFVSNAIMDTNHMTHLEIRSRYFDGMRSLMQRNANLIAQNN